MNEGTEYSAVDLDSISDKLDAAGKAELSWTLVGLRPGGTARGLYFAVDSPA
jgi:hypothetical protein